MKKLVLYTLLFLSLLSCRIGDLESVPVQVVNPEYTPWQQEFLTFNASLKPYQTKVSVDFENNLKQIWNKGDLVLICDAESGKEALYEAISGGKDTTTLVRVSGDTLANETGKVFTAYYPAEYKTGTLPSKVFYTDPGTISQIPMTGFGGKNLSFENACALVRCSYTPAADMLVKKITFSSDRDLAQEGAVEMDCTSLSPQGVAMYAGKSTTFSLCLNPGNYKDFKVSMSGDGFSEEVMLEYVLKASSNLLMNVDLNKPEGNMVNLTKDESANSYIIYHSGEYIFVPTKGCSSELIEGISNIEILWEMNNQVEAPSVSMFSDLKYADGIVSFIVPEPFTPGNALLAAKDSEGNVLWSWHIWGCEDTVTSIYYDKAGKYCMMDRSMGALAKGTTSPGDNKYASSLLYQWGRKDPFPGQTTQDTRELIAVTGTSRTIEKGPVTVETSIMNPTVFYASDNNWSSEPEISVWSSSDKSIYDPCPPGYIIPPVEAFSESADIFYPSYHESGLSRKGSFCFKLDDGTVFSFPLSAYYNGSSGKKEGKSNNVMWTSNVSDGSPSACYMYYKSNQTLLEIPKSMSYSTGVSLRCMQVIKND